MKKSINSSAFKFCTKIFIISALIVLSNLKSFGQVKFLSFQLNADKTGNGCIGNVSPALAFTYNNSSFSIGANFQREKMNLSGFQTSYSYVVAKNYNEKLELFLYGSLTYQNSAYMTHQNFEIEKASRPEENLNYENFRFKVIEGYTGFGLKINPVNNFNVAFKSGLGAYNTLCKGYNNEMFRCKSGVVLQVQMSLIYNFKTW